MAPFRRGKNGPRNSPSFNRGASARGSNGHRGGFRGISRSKPTSKHAFQASRVQELADDRSESPGTIPGIGDREVESEELLSHEDSSESDAAYEKSYAVLLQTLNPHLPHGEPRKKRRKIDTTTTVAQIRDPPSGDLDAVGDAEDGGNSSEEGSVDDFDVVDTQQGEWSYTAAEKNTILILPRA